MTGITGNIVHVTIDGQTLDLVEEDSVDYDAGESTNDFELAAETISETFHEVASPTLDWTSQVDEDAAGLEAAGVIDDTGNVVYSGNREVEDITVEYLDGDDGTVEGELDIPRGTLEWGGIDGQSPPTMDFTLHVNEAPTYDSDPGT